MVKPPSISLRIRAAQATVRARKILRRLDEEALARRRFRHFAAKGFLAASTMRGELAKLGPSDRAKWESEIERIEQTLLRMGRV